MTQQEIVDWVLCHGWRIERDHAVTRLGDASLRLAFDGASVTLEMERGAPGQWGAIARVAYADVMVDDVGNPLGLWLTMLTRSSTANARVAEQWRQWTGED
jgi:hypothetical protein